LQDSTKLLPIDGVKALPGKTNDLKGYSTLKQQAASLSVFCGMGLTTILQETQDQVLV
jgi:hypothetical protein